MNDSGDGEGPPQAPHEHIEDYGEVRSRHGKVNGWLAAVYLVLFLWALYYGFTFWGGLGPGLDY